MVTPYSSGLAARADASGDEAEQDLATQASALDDRCAAAFERQLADFTPATCDEHRTTACFEPGDADDACGGVEEHPRRGAPITLRASSGPLVDPSFCCALDTFSVATRGRVRLLRVGTQGIARVCGGGTAARVLDAIYRIRGHRLELVADESIGLH